MKKKTTRLPEQCLEGESCINEEEELNFSLRQNGMTKKQKKERGTERKERKNHKSPLSKNE
jgi:hypothetical protein